MKTGWKDRKIGIKTMNELEELFSLFGLSFSVGDHLRTDGYKTLAVVAGDGSVVSCEGWDRFDYTEKLQFTLTQKDLSDAGILSFIAESIIKSLSKKKCLVWKTALKTNIPFGAKTVRAETRVDLPDFSSIEELKMLMTVNGGVA